jgi:hypothetical protein
MALGSVVKQQHDCRIVVKDGAALTYTPSLFDGAATISNIQRKMRDVANYEVRGVHKATRHTARVYPTVTLTIQLANYAGSVDVDGAAEVATPGEVFNRLGAWAAATSTLPLNRGGGDVFCVDIDVILEGTDLGEAADHSITLKAVRGTPQLVVAEPATWQIECVVIDGFAGDIAILEG